MMTALANNKSQESTLKKHKPTAITVAIISAGDIDIKDCFKKEITSMFKSFLKIMSIPIVRIVYAINIDTENPIAPYIFDRKYPTTRLNKPINEKTIACFFTLFCASTALLPINWGK